MNGSLISLNDVQIRPDSLPQQATDASNTIFLINFRNHRDMYPPFGIMYVADALEKVGFRCRLFHETEVFVDAFVALVAAMLAAIKQRKQVTRPVLFLLLASAPALTSRPRGSQA